MADVSHRDAGARQSRVPGWLHCRSFGDAGSVDPAADDQRRRRWRDIRPLADGEYGINLVVGTHAEVLKLFEPGTINTAASSGLEILPATPSRRTTIVVTGATEKNVADALGLFVPATEMRGTPAGLRGAAAFPGYRMGGAQRVKLRELGMVSQEF